MKDAFVAFPLPRGAARVRGSSCFLIFIFFLVACARQTENLQPLTLISPTGERVELRVEVAESDEERSRGLMFREKLPEGKGMLFIFERPQRLSFWMKNTLIPLDVLFFDTHGKFVSAMTMEPCVEDLCQTYPSAAEAEFALEVPAGFTERHGIGEGWYGQFGEG